jgi:putative redox protein
MGERNETVLRLGSGLEFTATTPSGFELKLDSRVDPAAAPAGPSPMEVLLTALGGCTGMDTIAILRKMRQDVTSYEVRLSHTRAEEHPRVYTTISLRHILHGRGIAEANVQRAIELTMLRYCPVFAMLHDRVEIREWYEITDEETGSVLEGEVVPEAPAG